MDNVLDAYIAVLDAYIAAWNEPDPDVRASLLDLALTDGATLDGPTGTFRGREAIAGLVDALRCRMPGARIARVGPATPAGATPGGAIRFGWQVRTDGGELLFQGVDVAELAADGRISRMEVRTGEAP